MKYGILISILFSLVIPVIGYKITATDMSDWKSYETYCDSNGDLQKREIEISMTRYSDGSLLSYWQFHGAVDGLLIWLKATAFCFATMFPAVALSIYLARKDSANEAI